MIANRLAFLIGLFPGALFLYLVIPYSPILPELQYVSLVIQFAGICWYACSIFSKFKGE